MATGAVNELGVDCGASISLQFKDQGHASLMIDSRMGTRSSSEAKIYFKPGSDLISIKIPGPFWCPERLIITRRDESVSVEEFPIYPGAEDIDGLDFNYFNSQALAYEAESFANAFEQWIANKTAIEHPLRSHKDSILSANIIDQVMEQVKKSHSFQNGTDSFVNEI